MRYRLRTLLIVMAAAALFFAGYRLGLEHGRRRQLDDLMELIQRTVKPKNWGPADDPFAAPPTASPTRVDPFGAPDNPAADDPFALPAGAGSNKDPGDTN